MRVRRDDDRAPVLTRMRDRLSQPVRTGVIQIGEWLVHQEERDALGFDPRQSCPPALAGRETLDGTAHNLPDAPRASSAADAARLAAREPREDNGVLPGRETPQ